MEKISICIPTYNRARYLETLLDILINLPDQNNEIIVVDNKSPDNTLELLQNKKYQKLKIFQNERNVGMVNNWNRCVELASGDYVIIIHDDDIVTPNLFSEYRMILEKYPNVDFIFSYAGIVDQNAQEIGYQKTLKRDLFFRESSLFKLLLRENFIHASGVLVKKDIYSKVGKFVNKYTLLPDYDMWLRISLNHNAIYRDKLLFNYRKHSTNVSAHMGLKRILTEKLSVLKNCYNLLNSDVKNYKILKELIELLYRSKFKEYYQNFVIIKDPKENAKKFIKINLKFYFFIMLEFVKAFIQKPSIFETKALLKSYYYPFWSFGIILRFLKRYFNPPKGKVLISFFRKLRRFFFS